MLAYILGEGTLVTALRYTGDLTDAAQAYADAIASGHPVSESHMRFVLQRRD